MAEPLWELTQVMAPGATVLLVQCGSLFRVS